MYKLTIEVPDGHATEPESPKPVVVEFDNESDKAVYVKTELHFARKELQKLGAAWSAAERRDAFIALYNVRIRFLNYYKAAKAAPVEPILA